MSDRSLLLSLRPRFAEAILNGTKTVELRRRPIKAPHGTLVVLYASAPTMAVVGTARLVDVVALSPHTAWRRYRTTLSLSWSEFTTYLTGTDQAHLLRLDDVKELSRPHTLQALRRSAPFHPPQSFRYLHPTDPPQLHRLAHR
ncbi:putative transcriptional regulator [Kribbella rubisoli]|uniref:Transcriptional regulator n=1 Tax=Kribbella rubisoli TaxID=3075929 RepID=A0A4Q7X063_9ACTN|nr:ASCH domain-containing protein [Kribbella rubisoli]RZU16234.1 putative transcriptional regulator [Kribbella rubisoli]